jgi:hypothetical protein
MRGSMEAIGARPVAARTGRRWPGWITRIVRRDRGDAQERLEAIERLAAEQRRARRAGEYIPDLSWHRRWG